jgi:hypothetical protein
MLVIGIKVYFNKLINLKIRRSLMKIFRSLIDIFALTLSLMVSFWF